MKVEELMIGDWVQIDYRNKVVQVTGILDKAITTNAVSPLSEDEFKPIPITPEILQKNGFTKHEDTNIWVWEEKHKSNTDIIHQSPRVFFIKSFTRNSHYEKMGYYMNGWVSAVSEHGNISMDCESVHELQHALKFCKIEKEIVL